METNKKSCYSRGTIHSPSLRTYLPSMRGTVPHKSPPSSGHRSSGGSPRSRTVYEAEQTKTNSNIYNMITIAAFPSIAAAGSLRMVQTTDLDSAIPGEDSLLASDRGWRTSRQPARPTIISKALILRGCYCISTSGDCPKVSGAIVEAATDWKSIVATRQRLETICFFHACWEALYLTRLWPLSR